MKRTLSLALFIVVTACGGTGTGSSDPKPTDPGTANALTVVDPTYGTVYISPDGAVNAITDDNQIAQSNIVIQNIQQIFGFSDDQMKESLSRLVIMQNTGTAVANVPWLLTGPLQTTKETYGKDMMLEATTYVSPNGCVFDMTFAFGLADYLWCDQNYYRVKGAPEATGGMLCPTYARPNPGSFSTIVSEHLSDTQISALSGRFSTVTLCTRPPYTGNG